MAPKRSRALVVKAPADTVAKALKRGRAEDDEAPASPLADIADKETADELAPFVECKTEEGEDEDTPGARKATNGNGMHPLEVSRMLTMLNKRRKKDHACMRMCNTYPGI